VLLIVFLAASSRQSAQGIRHRADAQSVAFALIPAALVIAEPDLLGSRYFAIAFASCSWPAFRRQLTVLALIRWSFVFASDRPSDRVALLKHYQEQRLTGSSAPRRIQLV